MSREVHRAGGCVRSSCLFLFEQRGGLSNGRLRARHVEVFSRGQVLGFVALLCCCGRTAMLLLLGRAHRL